MAKLLYKDQRGAFKYLWWPCLIAGGILGIFICRALPKEKITAQTEVFWSWMVLVKDEKVRSPWLWWPILKYRLMPMGLLILLTKYRKWLIFLLGYLFYMGMALGYTINCLILAYGVFSILVFIAMTFPQYIFYILAFYLEIQYGMKSSGTMFGRNNYQQIAQVCLWMLFGCLAEIYINRFLVELIFCIM